MVKVLELEFQRQSFNESSEFISFSYWLVWSPCCPRNSQEFPPTPQFEGINVIILTCYKDSLRKYIIHTVFFFEVFQPSTYWVFAKHSYLLKMQTKEVMATSLRRENLVTHIISIIFFSFPHHIIFNMVVNILHIYIFFIYLWNISVLPGQSQFLPASHSYAILKCSGYIQP